MIEKRVAFASFVFLMAITGAIALSVRMFGIGLPTCLPDLRPFSEGSAVEQSPKHYEIRYVAKMWKFDPPEIALKPGSVADIYLSTPDVTHGVQIVGTNFNLMAVPGAVNYARVKFDRPGNYLVVCNEYCGTAHHEMAGMIRVTDQATTPVPVPEEAAAAGLTILEQNACTACHSVDGSEGAGPTFKGIYGTTREMADGSKVVVDEAYLRQSIENPNAKVVKGFEPNMPEMPVGAEDIDRMIEYIRTLK